MIAAAFLSIALFFTAVLGAHVWSARIAKRSVNLTLVAILTALSWGAFYYFHGA